MATPMKSFLIYSLFTLSQVSSTTLSTTYVSDFTMTQTGSPYYVTADVLFDASLTIEEGAEIIFNDNFQIEVRGYLNACNDVSIKDNATRGLVNPSTAIVVHGADTTLQTGRIYLRVDLGATADFCNIKFEAVSTALYVACCAGSGDTVRINNAQFENINVVFEQYSGSNTAVNDSILNNFTYAATSAYKSFSNCLFTNFVSVLSYTESISIYDSDIIGTGTETCLYAGRGTLSGCTITNCDIAIQSNWEGMTVEFNDISNSNIGVITPYSDASGAVYGNNFINNVINVQAPGSADQPYFYGNYWGTTDETTIASLIQDICNGYSTGLVTWYPYATQQIDFTTDITSEDTLNAAILSDLTSPFQCGSSGAANVLDSLYLYNHTLTVDNSPYYVKSAVIIQETLTIDAGVTIEFLGNYEIEVRGALIACSDALTAASTNTRGVFDAATAITITSNKTTGGGQGYIKIDTASPNDATATFCNVYFSHLLYGLSVTCCGGYANEVSVDNAEFDTIETVFNDYSGSTVNINDSIFNQFTYAATSAYKVFGNCLFTNFVSVLSYTESISIYDSDIIGTGTETCLYAGRGTLSGCTITNCDIAIQSNWEGMTVQFNDISNSNIGVITPYSDASAAVYGNNFINNVINVQAPGSADQPYFYGNYWGSTDETVIGSTIQDICSGFSTSTGLVTWYPYTIRQIDFNTDITSEDTVDSSILSDLQSPLVCGDPNDPSTLAPLYLSNVTLTTEYSPYYIRSNVIVKQSMIINKGVEIIFTGNYMMEIRGELDACGDPSSASASNVRGVYDAATAITITSNKTTGGGQGYIKIDTATPNEATATFCNVYFSHLLYGLSVTCCGGYGNEVSVDNAEFDTIETVFNDYSGSTVNINDSIFNQFTYAATSAYKVFGNCLFTNFVSVLSYTESISIYDSDIIGTGTETCLYAGRGTLSGSTVTNCGIAYTANWEGLDLYFNEISSSNIAVITGSYGSSTSTAYGNNFIDNTIIVQAPGSINQDDFCGNYWGTVDTAVIADKIEDAFDGDSTSIVTWDPYIIQPIDFTVDLITRGGVTVVDPALFSSASTNCGPQLPPTADPTIDPTVIPTENPTPAPTDIPTSSPTPFPTVNPSTQSSAPTGTPTIHPSTLVPTSSPTPFPTVNPSTDSSAPTGTPTIAPSTPVPTQDPTTFNPTEGPTTPNPTTFNPTEGPTTPNPTQDPTTYNPTASPVVEPTVYQTADPTTGLPTFDSTTALPTSDPTSVPTNVECDTDEDCNSGESCKYESLLCFLNSDEECKGICVDDGDFCEEADVGGFGSWYQLLNSPELCQFCYCKDIGARHCAQTVSLASDKQEWQDRIAELCPYTEYSQLEDNGAQCAFNDLVIEEPPSQCTCDILQCAPQVGNEGNGKVFVMRMISVVAAVLFLL